MVKIDRDGWKKNVFLALKLSARYNAVHMSIAISAVEQLASAINFDRFDDIQSLHAPGVRFHSFRGPNLSDNISVRDWQAELLERYADCTYTEEEVISSGDTAALRTTILGKGYDWRQFSQRALDIIRVDEDGRINLRHLYAMLRDIEIDKPIQAAFSRANEYPGGSESTVAELAEKFCELELSNNSEGADAILDENSVLIDSVYGTAVGAEASVSLLKATPVPAFGMSRMQTCIAGAKDAVVEFAVDPRRPRYADWIRVVEDKIVVIERYWMLREIGVNPFVEYSRDRHHRQVIMPK